MSNSDQTDIMTQTRELADDTRALARRLIEVGLVPKESIPGWVAGAVVTALVEELGKGDED